MSALLFVFLASTLISQSFMDAMSVVIILYMITIRVSKRTGFAPLTTYFSSKIEMIFFGLWLTAVAIGLKESPHFLNLLSEWKWILNLYFMTWFLNLLIERNSLKSGDNLFTVTFWRPLFWIMIACFVYGAISYKTGIDLFKQMPLNHGNRFAGPFDDPMNFAHIYGMYAAFIAPFLLEYLTSWLGKAKKVKFVYDPAYVLGIVTFSVTAGSVYLSLTRGAWIGLFIALVVMFFIYRWIWGLATLIVGCLGAFGLYFVSAVFRIRVDQALNPSRSYDSERYNLWRSNWEMFKDHPVFGIGHGEYKSFLPTYFEKLGINADHFQSHAHNQYLQFLSNTGLVGFMFYMIFIVGLFYITYKGYKRYRHSVLLGSMGAQIAFHIGSLTECNFERAKVRLVYLFFSALALSLIWHYQSKEVQKP